MIELVALCGGLVGGGLVLTWAGFHTPPTRSSTRFSTGVKMLTNGQGRWLLLGVGAGVVAFALTGWLVLLGAVPVMVVAGRALLATPPNREIALLEALDRWVRALAATMPTGLSVVDALRSTRRQTPALLGPSLDLALRRLDERWTTREALLQMADELASPQTDAVIAALILAAERGGTGATATLNGLADSIQGRLAAAREIETERAKPRIVVRQVTVIMLAVLGVALVVGRGFFAPYGTPLGQVLLAGLLAAYLGSLAMLRRLTTPRRSERILRRST